MCFINDDETVAISFVEHTSLSHWKCHNQWMVSPQPPSPCLSLDHHKMATNHCWRVILLLEKKLRCLMLLVVTLWAVPTDAIQPC